MDRLWNGLNIILKHISGLHVKQMKRINLNGELKLEEIQYKAKGSVDYTEIPRFSHMSYANKSGTSIGEVKRVDAALSSDRKKVFFWVMDNTGEIQYSFYNAEKLNAELDKKRNLKNLNLFHVHQVQ